MFGPPVDKIRLGNLKAILGSSQDVQPLFALAPSCCHKETSGGPGPPPDPAPQLVQLGKPKTVGMLHNHDGSFWNIHAHLASQKQEVSDEVKEWVISLQLELVTILRGS